MTTSLRDRLKSLRAIVQKRHALVLTLAFVLAALTTSGRADTPASPTTTKRLFWKITSPTTVVYFLGSIHVATPDMYPLPAEIEAAYATCDNLVVEADITKDGDQM